MEVGYLDLMLHSLSQLIYREKCIQLVQKNQTFEVRELAAFFKVKISRIMFDSFTLKILLTVSHMIPIILAQNIWYLDPESPN